MDSEFCLSVPGKSFLVGEYLALSGGPSILLSTTPRFSLKFTPSHHGRRNGYQCPFAPDSPAGRFLSMKSRCFDEIEFYDPHEGQGGLGASSAQFALVYCAAEGISGVKDLSWKKVLTEYHRAVRGPAVSSSTGAGKEGLLPSGADVVSHLHGGLTFWNGQSFAAERFEWDFPELSFTLVRTGAKLATHEHLKSHASANARTDFGDPNLLRSVERAQRALSAVDEAGMIEAVRLYGERLAEMGLVTSQTQNLLTSLRTETDFALAAKGCGAMGADVLLIVHDKRKEFSVQQWAHARDLQICGSRKSLSPQGLVGDGDSLRMGS